MSLETATKPYSYPTARTLATPPAHPFNESGPTTDAGPVAPDPLAWGAWHADPFGEAGERWWDGRRWTQQVRGTSREGAEAMPTGRRTNGLDGAASRGHKRVMAAGWYPWDAGSNRYWDGKQWTGERQRVGPDVTAARRGESQGGSWLIRIGYVAAVLVPLLGVVLGIIVATRPSHSPRTRQGIQIIVLSLIVVAIAALRIHH